MINFKFTMSSGGWKIQMIPAVSNFLNKRNVCCGLILVVLNAIAWPSLVVWILIDVGLVSLLIVPRIPQLVKKTSTRVNNMEPGSVRNERGGFSSAMSEALNSRPHNSQGSRIRPSSSRRTKYNHEFSRCTPDERDGRTPLPTISAIRNRLSYSAAEASIRSVTPTGFSPGTINTLQERNRMSHNHPTAHHIHTHNETVSSSVLHIARTNLPVAREACSPVIVKVAPLGASPRIGLVEAKNDPDTCRKEVVVNALKQITQKRKRVCPMSDSRDDDSSFLDSLPTVKKSRQEPAGQQAMKRSWTKTITNESFSKTPMPETKKHKASSNVIEAPPSLVQESMVIPPPAKTQTEGNHKAKDKEETKSTSPPIDREVTQILNTSDKENKSLDNENELSRQQDTAPSGILKKLRTIYPSSKPSIDAMRRKYPILCSSGVAPKLGRQSLKLKYEDYVKDREDVYAKVKQVLEEVDEAESEKKKKEKPTIASEPAGIPSDVKSTPTVSAASQTSAVSQVPQITSTPAQPVEENRTKTLLSISSTVSSISSAASTCSTVAPPPNVVISSTMSQIIPTAASSSGQLPSFVMPALTLAKPTSKPAEVPLTVNSSNLTIPKMPSLVGTTSQAFSFALPNVQSTTNSGNSQVKHPTLNFSMPASATTTSSLGIGTAFTIPSSVGKGLGLPLSSGTGLKLQLPTATSVATSTTNTVQLQPTLSHNTNTIVTSSGQADALFSTHTTASNINFSFSNKPSIFPAIATATTTNVAGSSGGLFASSAGSMEVASVPHSSVLGTTFRSNLSTSSSNQPTVNSAQNFPGLFASSTAGSVGDDAIASSVSGSQFGNLFGNPQTTAINTTNNYTTTTTSGQPFIFNIFQSSQTTAASSNLIQFDRQMSQPNNNISVSSTSSLFTQPQTQVSNSGFNFLANTTNSTSNFTFNLQPSVGSANTSSLFAAPSGGFNLPSTATAQPRRKTKTPARSKPKRK